ncbi:MAG TPA: AAA family ATPase [Polyangiales bacterium]|nr:AAA family ATPase [Polyangiales bacterium]
MKLRTLELRAFGSLRDMRLNFPDTPRLHVIYGPNEAGKSTALRALRGLFFGIPNNTKDAHTIKPAELRVGALLCDGQGRERYVLRRKGLKGTLRAEDDKTVLSPEDAAWVTAGMHASTFETQFGLTFETLHRGAEELLGTGGDLGQSLFAAAVSGGQVRRVLEQLEAEADALYRPKGVKMPLNTAIAQFEQAKKDSRELATKADVFEQQQSEVDRAAAECAEINRQLSALRAERIKLDRVQKILPLLSRQRARQAERQALGHVASLPAEAAQERKRVTTARRDAELRLELAQVEIARLQQARKELQQQVVPGLTSLPVSRCEDLRDRLSVYRDALRKLPAREQALSFAQAEVARALRVLQLTDADAAAIENLRLPKTLEVRAREELRKAELLRAEVAVERRKLTDVRHQLDLTRKKLWQLWSGPETSQQLSLLSRNAPRVEVLTEELCRNVEQRFEKLEQEQRELELKRQSLRDQLDENERTRASLSELGAPPSEADLVQCRAQRDAALDELRVLLPQQPEPACAVAYVERSVALTARADALADHMRRETDRVAQAARLAAEHTRLERSIARNQKDLQSVLTQKQHAQDEWAALFRQARLQVRLPGEALRILAAQRDLDVLCERLQREQALHERAHNDAVGAEREWTEGWSELAQALDIAVPNATSTAELEALLSARTDLLQRHDAACALERELRALTEELRSFEELTAQLCAAHLPELSELPAELAAERLIAAHQQTHSAEQQLRESREVLREREQAVEDAQRELVRAERSMEQLMHAAGVDDAALLEDAERRSARAQALDAELAHDASDLAEASGGEDPESVVAAAGMSLDEVRVRLAEIEEEYKQLDDRRLEQTEQLASKRMGLEVLHEKHQAGDAAGDAALHLEEIRELSETYVRLRLAASLLRREIAHYRERNRGPVLDKAAVWFSRLTLGAFEGLDVDYDDRDQPVLLCVRADEQRSRLTVAGLSTGTRDQLFLALRLASIEHLGTQRELMPLVLDDILVHFDDARARAALVALADFAETTQVIFFTHHEHLCELAREALPSQRLLIQRLPYTPVARQLLLAPS